MQSGARTNRTLLAPAQVLCVGGIGVIVLLASLPAGSGPAASIPEQVESLILHMAPAQGPLNTGEAKTDFVETARIQLIRADAKRLESNPSDPNSSPQTVESWPVNLTTGSGDFPFHAENTKLPQAVSRYPIDPVRADAIVDPVHNGMPDGTALPNVDSPSEQIPRTRYHLPPATSEPTIFAASSGRVGERRVSEPEPVLKTGLPVPQQPDLARATSFQLAEQPRIGEHRAQPPPQIDSRVMAIPPEQSDFQPDLLWNPTHDPEANMAVYNGKQCQPTQRPAIEWFRSWYNRGEIPPSRSWFGYHNPDQFQFIVAGDQRTAYASNSQAGDSTSLIASQLNLDFDLRLTSTERLHWFITPLTQGANSTRWLLDDDRFESEFNADLLFGYFEGDLGAMAGGLTNKTLPFDLPFSVGVMPLVIQNGVWMDDTILGIATTIPAQNMPALNISNIDITFLFGMDQLNSPAFGNDNNAAKIYAIMAFIEAWDGYVEADYAFLEDRNAILDRSYHNISIGYTRRYGFISNSTRVIANAGQSADGGPNTADGVLLLSENSLITGSPYNRYPYLNLFAGFDRPQSAARQAAAGGVLRNTGILFESDNLTGYPTLDATANDTFGLALGMNVLAPNFTQQLVLETAFLGTMGDDATRNASGNQYGVGARYQIPISNHSLIRMDAMYGFLDNANELHGARIEYRHKF